MEQGPLMLIFAYLDPNAGSLLLPAVVGGFGGIVVGLRYLWINLRGTNSVEQLATTRGSEKH